MRAFGLKLGVAIKLWFVQKLFHSATYWCSPPVFNRFTKFTPFDKKIFFPVCCDPGCPPAVLNVTCPDIRSPSTELPLLVVNRNIWSKYLVPPRPSVSSSCPLPTGWYAVPLNMTHRGTKAGTVISQFVLLCNRSLTEGFSVTLFLLEKFNEYIVLAQFQISTWLMARPPRTKWR